MKGGWIVSDLGNKEVMAKNIKYYLKENDLIIASEIKAILMYLGKSVVDKTGIKELLG